MKQIWITHVHILCSKTLKKQEVWEKNSKRKRVRKWNVCSSSSSQVVQEFVAQTKTLCTFFYFFPQTCLLTNQPWACSLNKPTIQNLVKANVA